MVMTAMYTETDSLSFQYQCGEVFCVIDLLIAYTHFWHLFPGCRLVFDGCIVFDINYTFM